MKKLMPVLDATGGFPPMLFSLAGAQEVHIRTRTAWAWRSTMLGAGLTEHSCSCLAAMQPGIVNFTDELTGASRRTSNSNPSQQALLFRQAIEKSRMFQTVGVSPT